MIGWFSPVLQAPESMLKPVKILHVVSKTSWPFRAVLLMFTDLPALVCEWSGELRSVRNALVIFASIRKDIARLWQ